jgi:hypothetical protein
VQRWQLAGHERVELPACLTIHRILHSRGRVADGANAGIGRHLERAVAAIRSAAEVPGNPAVTDALAAAVDRREARERVLARKRKQEETAAAGRQEEG